MATTYLTGTYGWYRFDGTEPNSAEVGTHGWFDELFLDFVQERLTYSRSKTIVSVHRSPIVKEFNAVSTVTKSKVYSSEVE